MNKETQTQLSLTPGDYRNLSGNKGEQYAVRILMQIVKTLLSGYNGLTEKFNTIEKLIQQWHGWYREDTQKYIDEVCSSTGISSRQRLAFFQKKQIMAIVRAMILYEVKIEISQDILSSAYDMS